MLIKILGNQVALSALSNTTVNNAVVVRLVHTGSQEHVITVGNGNGSNIGTFTMLNNSELILEKERNHTLQVDADGDILATPIAYKN